MDFEDGIKWVENTCALTNLNLDEVLVGVGDVLIIRFPFDFTILPGFGIRPKY